MKKIILTLIFAASTIIHAEDLNTTTEPFFPSGQITFGIIAGQQTVFDNDYTVIGGNIHYFVLDDLSVGFGYTQWLGDDPSIGEVNIPVTYYAPLSDNYRPYLGAFVSRTFLGEDKTHNYDDYTSYGARIGMTMQTGNGSYISAGWVQEKYDNGIESGNHGYPEVSMILAF